MEDDKHVDLENLLHSYPLYKSVSIIDFFDGALNPFMLEGSSFNFFCAKDNDIQTFHLKIEPEHFFKKLTAGTGSDSFFPESEGDSRWWKYLFSGECQKCKSKQVYFFIKCEFDAELDSNFKLRNPRNIKFTKIGQDPAYQINPEKEINSYLTNEDQTNYKKALICHSQNFSIGSFAYLRRVIENEIIRIIKDISELDGVDGEVKTLIEKFNGDHQMNSLIDAISKYLPDSFKYLGDNPIKMLYKQLSGGLHQLTEEECHEKSKSIRLVLNYVIKKLNEERTEMAEVKRAIAQLKKG